MRGILSSIEGSLSEAKMSPGREKKAAKAAMRLELKAALSAIKSVKLPSSGKRRTDMEVFQGEVKGTIDVDLDDPPGFPAKGQRIMDAVYPDENKIMDRVEGALKSKLGYKKYMTDTGWGLARMVSGDIRMVMGSRVSYFKDSAGAGFRVQVEFNPEMGVSESAPEADELTSLKSALKEGALSPSQRYVQNIPETEIPWQQLPEGGHSQARFLKEAKSAGEKSAASFMKAAKKLINQKADNKVEVERDNDGWHFEFEGASKNTFEIIEMGLAKLVRKNGGKRSMMKSGAYPERARKVIEEESWKFEWEVGGDKVGGIYEVRLVQDSGGGDPYRLIKGEIDAYEMP